VGLGTPKQDEVLAGLVDRVDAVVVGVGAAFDFLSAAKREAPKFLQGTGLEWLYRLLAEPRRLWRRYLIGNAQFVFHAATSLRGGRTS
jgi:N-acetylglucosaminyldiphosphoundecaprenol N-acetyl-beta-D-mannosaminyltransferase